MLNKIYPVPAIGIDIGGVITHIPDNFKFADLAKDSHLKITTKPGAFEALRRLVTEKYHDNVYVISKCNDLIEDRTKDWLNYHHFCDATGIKPDHIIFCRNNPDKAEICRGKGIQTAFIDNRMGILKHFQEVRRLYLFCPDNDEVLQHGGYDPYSNIKLVNSWAELLAIELAPDKTGS
jgi:hypothetical protein